jgi:hypothetical protein
MATNEAGLLCIVYARSPQKAVTRESELAAMAWLGVYTVSIQHLISSNMHCEND